YEHNIRSALDEHLRSFGRAWELMRQKLIDSLLTAEVPIFNALATEHQREGFFIARAFARAAKHQGKEDFEIAQSSLADRLSITPPGAACVIHNLCELKAIELTQRAIRHKAAARFRWAIPPPRPPPPAPGGLYRLLPLPAWSRVCEGA